MIYKFDDILDFYYDHPIRLILTSLVIILFGLIYMGEVIL